MKILVSYRGIPQSPGWATGDMVVKALKSLGHDAYPYAKFYQRNEWVNPRPLLDQEWDLLLFLECNDGDPQYPELRLVKTKHKACWLFDTSYYADKCQFLQHYFNFDFIFLANPINVQDYKVAGYNNVYYLPYACDPDLHGRLNYNKTRDIVLVGSIREDRKQLASSLAKDGINLELIGGVFRQDYIDALASARIVINQNPEQGRGLLNMRFFEAPAAGTVLLTEKIDLNIQPIDLKFAIPYDNNLANICKNLLTDNEKLIQLSKEAQQEVLNNHTYQNRCQQLLKIIFKIL